MLWVLIKIAHNIGFYKDLTNIIFQLSSNTRLISSSDSAVAPPDKLKYVEGKFILLYTILIVIWDQLFKTNAC